MHSSIMLVPRKVSVLCFFVNIIVLRRSINNSHLSFKFLSEANLTLLLTGTVHFEKLKVKCSEGHTGDRYASNSVYVCVSLPT